MPAVVLTFFVYEEAHRRAVEWPRFEFRSACREHRFRPNSQRGDRDSRQQPRRRARPRTREIARHRHARIPSKGLERETYDRQVVAVLNEQKVDLVCLAGYMRLLSPYFVAAFPNRILNIHPSLLPSFPGLESQRQALEYGVKFAGCTVHFVDENLDAGPIVLQAVLPVNDNDTEDTLSARILQEEHRIYSEAVRIVLEGRYKIEGRRVIQSN